MSEDTFWLWKVGMEGYTERWKTNKNHMKVCRLIT